MADGALFRIQEPRRGLPACLRTVVLFAHLRHRQCERGGPATGASSSACASWDAVAEHFIRQCPKPAATREPWYEDQVA